MDIVFLGSGAFGLPTLERLAREHTLRAVVTQPDRRAGRGGKTTPTPIGAWAQEHRPGAALLKPERVNDDETRERIRAIPCDAWVVIAFGQYLGQRLIEDRFAINLHASLLPRWRGAAPIHAAILAGDAVTGNSVITIAREMDAGDVLARTPRSIAPDQTAGSLHDQLANDGPDLVLGVLAHHARGTLVPESQDPDAVTLAPKLSRDDAWVDLARGAHECARRINALSPWPGVTVEHRAQPLKLVRAQPALPVSEERAEPGPLPTPGVVLDPARGLVACGEGAIQLLEVQPQNKRAMAWRDYANGRSVEPGERLIGKADSP